MGAQKRILVVDDERFNVKILFNLLKADYAVMAAKDGKQALKAARGKYKPDLIVLDIIMPGMNGYEVCLRLKSDPETKMIPVIFITAMNAAADESKGFELGAVDFITKPFNPQVVKARVKTHLMLKDSMAEVEARNQFIRKAFGRFISDEVVACLIDKPQGLGLGGDKRLITILMSDLRGFTSVCENLAAEAVMDIINIYLNVMTSIILKHKGTINEFVGDAILVIFGAPIARDDDAIRAVACGLEMQLGMAEVNGLLREKGYPALTMGIGINTGTAVVGNIGSKQRIKYGVVGRQVNLTARVESYTLGNQIFITESTRLACGPVLNVTDKMHVSPKGVKGAIPIFEVSAIAGEYNLALPEKQMSRPIKLRENLPVKFTFVSEKHVGRRWYPAVLTRISGSHLEVKSALPVDRLDDIKFQLSDYTGELLTDDLYAKVSMLSPEDSETFIATITSSNSIYVEFVDYLISNYAE